MAKAEVQTINGYIELNDLAGLQRFAPIGFNFNQNDDLGMPLLHKAVFAGLYDKQPTARLKMLEWMLARGADPALKAGSTVGKRGVHKIKNPRETTVEISLDGHSAISMAFEFRKALNNSKSGADWSAAIKFLEDAAFILGSSTRKGKCERIEVDSRVMDLWEKVRSMTSTHNVTFDTADGHLTAHDHILSAASPVLEAMLLSAMREGANKRISLPDSTKKGVSLFIDMLYTTSTHSEPDHKTMLEALDLAHCWQVPNVIDSATRALQEMITPGTFEAIAEVAVRLKEETLQAACATFGTQDATVQEALRKGKLPVAVRQLLGHTDSQAADAEASAAKKRRVF
mmetsp:Transcript_60438/g.141348  ORF Transcript_60438/g.141348 Transcript_60438/m.141348 type:complete len:343 (-) Transcript_60438:74-1102(-)